MTTWNFCPDIYIQKVLISSLLACHSFVSFQSCGIIFGPLGVIQKLRGQDEGVGGQKLLPNINFRVKNVRVEVVTLLLVR